jgi:hypothetical protein
MLIGPPDVGVAALVIAAVVARPSGADVPD